MLTTPRPLLYELWQCRGGPCAGEWVVLTENDDKSAWLEWRGKVGRYESNNHGKLIWRRQECAECVSR